MNGQPPCHPGPSDSPWRPPPAHHHITPERRRHSEHRLDMVMNQGTVGSLPERLSWLPAAPHYFPPPIVATSSAVPRTTVGGSLGSSLLCVETLDHPCSCFFPTSSITQPPPYLVCSSSTSTRRTNLLAAPHSLGHIAEIPNAGKLPVYPQCVCQQLPHAKTPLCTHILSVPIVPSPAELSPGQANLGHVGETTPLLASCGRGHEHQDGEQVKVGGNPCLRRFHRKQLLTLTSMLIVVVTAFASLSIMAPFFPHQAEKMGISKSVDGIIFSTYPCVVFVFSPLVGKILPLLNIRDVYLVGITVTGLANIFFGMVSYINGMEMFLVMSIVLRMLAALGTSCFLTVIYALVPIIFPDDLNMVNGMMETGVGVGMCVGPALGVWLFSIGGFPLPFFGLGAFIILAAFINCFSFSDDELCIVSIHGIKGVWSVVSHPRAFLSLVILSSIAVCSATLYPTLQPHMHTLGISVQGVGLVYLILSAVYAVASPLVGLAIDRYGGLSKFMFAGLLLTALSFILIGNSPLLPPPSSHHELYVQDVVGMVMFGVSCAMCIVPTYGSVLQAATSVGDFDMGTFSIVGGLWSASFSLGEMLGPLYSGLLSGYVSFATSTTITAMLPAALALVLGTHMCANHLRSPRTRGIPG